MTGSVKPTAEEGRRAAILTGALACFVDKGVPATAIEDIRARSGASVGSIYHHFGNKRGIAAALYLEGLKSKNAALEHRLKHARTARSSLRAVMRAHLQWLENHPDWARFLYEARASVAEPEARSQLKAVNRDFTNLIDRHFGPYMTSGDLRTMPLGVLLMVVFGPLHELSRRWLAGELNLDIKTYERELTEAAWRAIKA